MREALLALLLRLLDDYRFGLRPCTAEEFSDLVGAWRDLNGGDTPAEAVLRLRVRSPGASAGMSGTR